MSSRRSETEPDILTGATAPSNPDGGGDTAPAGGVLRYGRDGGAFRDSAWWYTLKANGPLPLVVLAVALLMPLVESRAFGAYNARVVMLVGFNIILAVSLQLINGFSGQFSLGHAGFMMV